MQFISAARCYFVLLLIFMRPASHSPKFAALMASLCSILLVSACSTHTPGVAAAAEVAALEKVSETDLPVAGTAWTLAELPDTTAEVPETCSDVLTVTVRGTAEPYGEKSLVVSISNMLKKKLEASEDKKSDPFKPESDSKRSQSETSQSDSDASSAFDSAASKVGYELIDVDYPASSEFGESAPEGMRKLIDILEMHSTECPKQEIALIGYSQGAYVIGEALTDPDSRLLGRGVGVISDAALDRVKAIIFYGDPRFLGSDSFAYGTFKESVDGALPRLPGALDRAADRIRSFCVAEDIVCQTRDSFNEEGHIAYFDNGMREEGVEFILDHLDAK